MICAIYEGISITGTSKKNASSVNSISNLGPQDSERWTIHL